MAYKLTFFKVLIWSFEKLNYLNTKPWGTASECAFLAATLGSRSPFNASFLHLPSVGLCVVGSLFLHARFYLTSSLIFCAGSSSHGRIIVFSFIHLFLERGEGREEGEKHQRVVASHWGPSLQPRHVP